MADQMTNHTTNVAMTMYILRRRNLVGETRLTVTQSSTKAITAKRIALRHNSPVVTCMPFRFTTNASITQPSNEWTDYRIRDFPDNLRPAAPPGRIPLLWIAHAATPH